MSCLVLLAEPNASTRRELSQVLARAGMLPMEVADGRDAIACLCRPRLAISVAILDADLPGVDTTTIVALLRSNVRLRHMPTIILAPPGRHWDGHSVILRKPVDARMLLQTVCDLLLPPSMAA